jgi:hypothetical protein
MTVLVVLAVVVCLWLRNAARQYGMAIDLGQAIISHDRAKAKALLQAGAAPNAGDMDDAVVLALHEHDRAMVSLLLRYGADPSLSLMAARDADDAKALLRLGADPNARVHSVGWTPLMYHAVTADAEVVRLLLSAGGDVTVRDARGRTILQNMDYAEGNHPEQTAEYARTRALIVGALSQAGH